jgi:predicted DNA-binding protein
MLSIRLDPDIERRLRTLAKRTGRSEADLAQQLIELSFEDLEDIAIAEARLANPQPALTLDQVRKELGLDD